MTTGEKSVINSQAERLAKEVLSWWFEHQYDTTGDRGEWIVYDRELEFVSQARAMAGALGLSVRCRGCGHVDAAESASGTCRECHCMTQEFVQSA